MKITKLLTLSGIAAATISFAAQDAPVLKRTLTANSAETYKIQLKTDETVTMQSQELPLSVATDMTLSLKGSDLDAAKGLLNVEVTTSVDNIKTDGPLQSVLGSLKIKPIVQKGTLDSSGILKLEAAKDADFQAMMLAGAQSSSAALTLVQLPNKSVKVGDTWDINVEKGPFTAPDDQKLTAKLVGERTVDGHNCWVVSITGTLNQLLDSSKVQQPTDASSPLGNTPMIMKSKMEIDGEGAVDKATGQTISFTTKEKVKGTLEAGPINADSSGLVTTSVKLQAPGT